MRYDLCIRPVLNCIYSGYIYPTLCVMTFVYVQYWTAYISEKNSRILRASIIFGFFELVFYVFEFPFWYLVRSVLDIVFLGALGPHTHFCYPWYYAFTQNQKLLLHQWMKETTNHRNNCVNLNIEQGFAAFIRTLIYPKWPLLWDGPFKPFYLMLLNLPGMPGNPVMFCISSFHLTPSPESEAGSSLILARSCREEDLPHKKWSSSEEDLPHKK